MAAALTREQEAIFRYIRLDISVLTRCVRKARDIASCGESRSLVAEAEGALWDLQEQLRELEYDLEPTPWPFRSKA